MDSGITKYAFIALVIVGLIGKFLPKIVYQTIFWLSLLVLFQEYYLYWRLIQDSSPTKKQKGLDLQQYESYIKKALQKKLNHKDPVTKRMADLWNLDADTANEVGKYVEFIVRDFITIWYNYVSRNEIFVHDVEDVVGNAISTLVVRAKKGINIVVFAGDKLFDILHKTLKMYRLATAEVVVANDLYSKGGVPSPSKNSLKEIDNFNIEIAEEFRSRKKLHAVFYCDDSFVSGNHSRQLTHHDTTSHLSPEEFFDTERLKRCEENYIRYICNQLARHLIISRDDYNCRGVRHLTQEILCNSVLGPVYGLFTPSTVNIWIDMLFTYVIYPTEQTSATSNSTTQSNANTVSNNGVDKLIEQETEQGKSLDVALDPEPSPPVDALPSDIIEDTTESAKKSNAEAEDEDEARDNFDATPLDPEFMAQQERIVTLFELQGAVDEFLQGTEISDQILDNSNSGHGNDAIRININLSRDSTATHALGRLLNVLEIALFHGTVTESIFDSPEHEEEKEKFSMLHDLPTSNADDGICYFRCCCPQCIYDSNDPKGFPATFLWTVNQGYFRDTLSQESDKVTKCFCTDSKTCLRMLNSWKELQAIGLELTDQIADTKKAQGNFKFIPKESYPKVLLFESLKNGKLWSNLNEVISQIKMDVEILQDPNFVFTMNNSVNIWLPNSIFRSKSESDKLLELLKPLDRKSLNIVFPDDEKSANNGTDGSKRRSSFKFESAFSLKALFGESSSSSKSSSYFKVAVNSPGPRSESADGGVKKKSSESTSMRHNIMSSLSSLSDKILPSMPSMPSIPSFPEGIFFSDEVIPEFLTFSRNIDIIGISHGRIEASEETWNKKKMVGNSVGRPVSIGDTLKAEAMFKLSILLRDRPDRQFLEDRGMYHEPEVSYSVRAIRFEKLKSAPSGATKSQTSISSSEKNVVIYYFLVERTSVFHFAHEPSVMVESWTITRRYSDFDDFHKHIKSQLSTEAFETLNLPQKKYIQVVQGSEFYIKRMYALEEYMKNLLKLMPANYEIVIFLSGNAPIVFDPLKVNNDVSPPSQGQASTLSSSPPTELSSPTSLGGKELTVDGDQTKVKPLTIPAKVVSAQATNENTGSAELTSPQNPQENEIDFSDSIDPQSILTMELRILELVTELLEMKEMGLIRRHFVSFLIQSIRFFFSHTASKWVNARAKDAVSDSVAALALRWIRNLVWPNGVLWVPLPWEETEEAALKLRNNNRKRLIAMLPSALGSYIGEKQGLRALNKLLDMFDNPYILKSFIYMAIDMVLIETFPELAEKLSGMDNL